MAFKMSDGGSMNAWRSIILILISLCNGSSSGAQECPPAQEQAYDEYVETPCKRRPNPLQGYDYDEEDPSEELEENTSWPSRNEEFSDQLFTPNGGPW
jgi:hypothetical protein